ncbi:amino acid ABC transporter permease [Aeromicrobium sp.]|jgi:polar amino acid transport system permease protein|uniref:amino acid ABC transporter permease n=1 Tax=Aeromicrobium sp. TaxID=1871063 RepID=UPI0025B826BF|nr:amino acid ABC transporter permease [Aeromicrobium sp.]MCK5890329.1 amino acid ABC transporter permease [Aeromicrobium sp.]
MTEIWNDWLTHHDQLLGGLWVSLRLAFMALLLGLPAGLVLAVGASSRRRVLRGFIVVVIEIGRGTPALVMLQVVYNGIPVTLTGFVCAYIALALTTAAYTSEIIRGGLQSVPGGEIEAGRALGMSSFDVLRDIVIPQGLRIAIPPLMGFCILMFQATSLAFIIAVPELTSQARSIANNTFHYLNLFVIAGVLYAIVTVSASLVTEQVEKKLQRHV